ncbi:Flagellar biosynthetic protein FlhB [Jannaschia seosinensis]|uniref:Flagellar biosynthetic protein FlhB n=1 Tax=Jannaschia seosinensis TaxID=313367 RepID=A0A0M7BH29_9RHOB|nr:flagellar type III secretion system protein FlhB [Jannaschia seosinensis]CUH40656.1 Flagellar biosynthetic protein FlhB [Jannaschia seosinensis]
MSEESGAERSHEPTPQKLQQAREKGDLVRSQDVATSAGYAGVLICLVLVAPGVARRLTDLGGALIQNAGTITGRMTRGDGGKGAEILWEATAAATLMVAAPAALVVAALLAQRAIVFAPTKLSPKLSRVSVLANAKNKFGPSGLFEFAKSATKMGIYGALLVGFLMRHSDRIISASAVDPRAIPALLPEILWEFVLAVVLISGAIAAADYAWQQHSHIVKNRMTRQEVLDESKQSEGDPHMKQKRRQRAQEIAMNSMLADVPEATVVVVNPTHYAVALKWSPMDPSPPVCVAKGVDHVAMRIREVATDAGIPLYSDPPTARALHATTEIGDPIDRAHFAAVAAAVRFARDLAEAKA